MPCLCCYHCRVECSYWFYRHCGAEPLRFLSLYLQHFNGSSKRERSRIRLCAASSGVSACFLDLFIRSRSQKNLCHLILSFLCCLNWFHLHCIDTLDTRRPSCSDITFIKAEKIVIVEVTEEMSSFCVYCGAQTCSRLSIDFLLSLESICKLHLDISRACLCNVILALTPAPPFPTPPHRLRHTKCPAKDH